MIKKVSTLKEYQVLGKIKSVDTRRTEVAGQEIERQIGGFSSSFIDHEKKRISFHVGHTLRMLARGLRASITKVCSHLLQAHDDSD